MGVDFFPCHYCQKSVCDCGDYYRCDGCLRCWCSQECAVKEGCRVEEGWDGETCNFCRGDDVEDDSLLSFLLGEIGWDRKTAVEKYKEEHDYPAREEEDTDE